MKPEIVEALAIELTKATIANLDPLQHKITSAELWVNIYKESVASIEAESNKNQKHQPPRTGGHSTVFD